MTSVTIGAARTQDGIHVVAHGGTFAQAFEGVIRGAWILAEQHRRDLDDELDWLGEYRRRCS